MNGPETRESLLASLNTPISEGAWVEFVEIYRPLVFRVAISKGLQHADAEDLTQEVLATVERSLNSYDANRGSFRSWLYQITRNLVVNHLTRGREPIGSGDTNFARMLAQYPDEMTETATLFRLEYRRSRFKQAAEMVRSEFQESTWRAFWLTAIELRSIASVAKELGKSQGAIRVARCRVLDRIRVVATRKMDDDVES